MRSPRVLTQYLFLIGILVFCLIFVAMMIGFALPRPEYIEVGLLSDFPPAPYPYPYHYSGEISLFIVNEGNEIIVLGREAENINGIPINVNWISRENSFINPFGGTHYGLNGCPIWWALNFETVSPMIRYPVEILEGVIIVELSDPYPACDEMSNSLMLPDRK